MSDKYNDSNYTMRSSRTYKEATGKPIRKSDFEPDQPIATKKDAVFWSLAIALILTLSYLTR
jgi:hypothetical protein